MATSSNDCDRQGISTILVERLSKCFVCHIASLVLVATTEPFLKRFPVLDVAVPIFIARHLLVGFFISVSQAGGIR